MYLVPKTLVIMSHTFQTTDQTVQFATPNAFAVIIREPWSFKKYRVMASCFSTDNTSSPLGLLPGWRKGRNSSTTDVKTVRFILKFFFHSLSGKIPLNKLSHHCSVLSEFLHILPRRRLILVRMCRSRATAALYFCVAWTVNCLWRRLCIIKSGNKKPQHWKVAAKHLVKEKVHSQLRCVICPPFCLFTCFATMQQPLVTSPRGPVVLRLHVNASYFSTTVRRVTPPTLGPPLPCKQALIFFRDCQSSGIIIF